MSNQAAQGDLSPQSPPEVQADGTGVQKTDRAGADNRDASARMLALHPAAFPGAKPAPETCRHFRNQVPREIADELRDADPEPCPVCDALPHRRAWTAQSAK